MNASRSVLSLLCAAALATAASTSDAGGRYDARLRFRVLRTPHFTIYFHQGEDVMAARLADIAESVRADLAARTGLDAPPHAHVVLVDQSDVSNGWSTPVPYNLIEIAAVWPAPSDFLGHHDDWLRIVFTHEYAHVLHLDRVGGVMKGLRWALGRNAATFPNLFVPQWAIEGIATWAESEVTGLGRLHAADVRSVVASASARGGATIDRAGGGLVAWPSGHAPYFLGGAFDQAIAEKYSPRAIGDLSRETARRLPFLGGGAYNAVLGTSAGDVWRTVFDAAPARPAEPPRDVIRLTHEGFTVSGPRLVRRRSPNGQAAETVYYSARGPHRFPDIRMIGQAGGTASHVASRFGGQVLSSDGRWLYFDQLEFDGPSALVADLYARDLESGRERRLSRGARLADPDVDASGARMVAVQARDGEKSLTIWRLDRSADGVPALGGSPEQTIASAGCQYASPRWSPDASRIAAIRQCRGSLPVVVEADASSGAQRVVASGSRNITPTWSRDGRTILFASDREDGRFKLFAIASTSNAGRPEVVLDAPGGVVWPDVAADGETVVFTSLTADGWDVHAARIRQPAGHASGSVEQRQTFESAETPPAPAEHDSPVPLAGGAPAASAYSAWRTLLPRAWSPLLNVDGDDVSLGAMAGASDALGYHQYSASASWHISGEEADLTFSAPPITWSLSYAYNRWRPSLLLSVWQGVDTVGISDDGYAIARTAQERSQGLFAGFLIPWRRIRLAQSWLAGVEIDERVLPGAAGIPARSRNGVRAGWALTSSREYGYSISPEDGFRATLNVERVIPSLGADAKALSITADARAYVPGLRTHHVVALRAAAASSTGDRAMTRTFSLGGSGASSQAFLMAKSAVGLVRGLPPDERVGRAVFVANGDYRFPLARVERGVRTWPFFLRDFHGAVFADVGSAGSALDDLPSAASSVGAEIASRLTVGYSWNLSVAAGAAWVRDPIRAERPDRFAAFVRTAYAF